MIFMIISFKTAFAQTFSIDSNNTFFYINAFDGAQLRAISKTPILNNLLKIVSDAKCKAAYGFNPSEYKRNCLEYKSSSIINPSIGHILIRRDNSNKKLEDQFISQIEKSPLPVLNVINEFVRFIPPYDHRLDLSKLTNSKIRLIVNGKHLPIKPEDICLSKIALKNSLIIRPKEAGTFFKSDDIIIFINDRE